MPRTTSRVASLAAEEDMECTFEQTVTGASHTYPAAAGTIRKGSYVMLKGHPCKVAEVATSKTGKHGHAKAMFLGFDIFTGKKYEESCQTSHTMQVPVVERSEYLLSGLDEASKQVSVLNVETCCIKSDLNLPTVTHAGEPTEEDVKVQKDIIQGYAAGKNVVIVVLAACGQEKIVSTKVTED
mmetsp:Transcript_116112/g.211232  ORF Transcript_116112/g.211232 Transcript_116112/m.211232 type:complete len:183 (-) Transcript_116112:98-646(-)